MCFVQWLGYWRESNEVRLHSCETGCWLTVWGIFQSWTLLINPLMCVSVSATAKTCIYGQCCAMGAFPSRWQLMLSEIKGNCKYFQVQILLQKLSIYIYICKDTVTCCTLKITVANRCFSVFFAKFFTSIFVYSTTGSGNFVCLKSRLAANKGSFRLSSNLLSLSTKIMLY